MDNALLYILTIPLVYISIALALDIMQKVKEWIKESRNSKR